MSTAPQALTVDDLAAKLKAKYPDYASIDNTQLIAKLTTKHPEYHQALVPAESERIKNSQAPGAMQAKPGGAVFNAKGRAQPGDEGGPTIGGVARQFASGASSAVMPEEQQSTDWKKNIGSILKNTQGSLLKAGRTPWKEGGPWVGVMDMFENMVKAPFQGMNEGGNEAAEGLTHLDSEKVAHGLGKAGGNALSAGLLKKAPEAMAEPFPKEALRNLENQGTEKAAFLGRQVETANAVQQHVKTAADALHNDGKQLMGAVSEKIDAAKPEGVFDKAEVRARVKDAMGVVKVPEKVPAAIDKILSADKVKQTTGPTIGGRHLDLSNPNDFRAYQAFKQKGIFTPDEVSRFEGGEAKDKWGFEQLKQLHSDLGRTIHTADGPVEAGVKTAYGTISEMLKGEAEKHGLLNEWEQGRQKVKTFYDVTSRGPLKDTYWGDNHGKIMKPLISDDLSPKAWEHLEQISPYGVDLDKVKQSAESYKHGEKWDRLSEPNKRIGLIAALSPKMAVAMSGAPRFARSVTATQYLHGKGLEGVPAIKPSKVYPTKAEALAKLKK